MVLILSRSCRLRHGWLYSSIRRYPKVVRTITPGKYTGREGREEGGREGGRGERERNLHNISFNRDFISPHSKV